VVDGLEAGHFNNVDEGVAEDSHKEQVRRLAAYNKKMAGENPPIELGLREVGNWAKVGHYGDPIKTAWYNIAKYGIRNNKFNDSVDRAMSAIGDFPDKYDLSIPEIGTLYNAYETVYDQWEQLQGQQGVAEGTFDGQELVNVLKKFDQEMNEVGGYGDPDHNKIMAALNNRDIETALDIVWAAYNDKDGGELRNMDSYIEDLESEFKFLVYSDPTQRVREGAHTSTIAAMANSVYQPKVGDKIRTRKGGQIPGTVEKIGDQDGIDYCWFRHTEGKMYKTPCSNVMREDMDEDFMDTIKKGAKAVDKFVTGGDDEDLIKDLQRKIGVPQTGKKPEPKTGNIEMNEELAQIMALAGMHEAADQEGVTEAQSPAQKAAFAAMIAKKSGDKPKAKDDGTKSDDNKKPDDDGDGIPNWVKGESAKMDEASKPDFLDLDDDGNKKEKMSDASKDMDEDFTDMLALAGLSEKKNPEEGVAEGLHPMVAADLEKLKTLNPVDRYSAYANIRGYFKADPALSKMASDLQGGYYEAEMLRSKYKTDAAKAKYAELEPMHQAFIKQAIGQEQGELDEASHQADTTMKHVKNPTQGEKDAAKKIKPGIAGVRDRFDMLASAEKDGRLKNESTIAEDEELAYVKHLLNKWL